MRLIELFSRQATAVNVNYFARYTRCQIGQQIKPGFTYIIK